MIARLWKILLTVVMLTPLALAWMVYTHRLTLPYRWNPFAPYVVGAPLDALTPVRFWRTVRDPQRCSAALATSSLNYRNITDVTSAAGCVVRNAKRIENGELRFNHSFIASCPLALALARFDRETLQPVAQTFYHQPVSRVNHVGSYACRAVRTTHLGGDDISRAPSEHAHANAIDLTGFMLRDGKTISVERDWHADDVDARFLHAVHDGACGIFATTLGPDYNGLHRTHFHLDMGPYRMCR